MAEKKNIVIDQGSDFSSVINVQESNSSPFDLTNYTVESQMRKSYYAETAHNFTTSHSSANGTITIEMSKTDTANLVPGRYMYDVFMTSNTDYTTRVVEGIVTVTPGITRS